MNLQKNSLKKITQVELVNIYNIINVKLLYIKWPSQFLLGGIVEALVMALTMELEAQNRMDIKLVHLMKC